MNNSYLKKVLVFITILLNANLLINIMIYTEWQNADHAYEIVRTAVKDSSLNYILQESPFSATIKRMKLVLKLNVNNARFRNKVKVQSN